MTIRELLAEESPTLRRRLASLFSGLPDETPASPLSCACLLYTSDAADD